MMQAKQVWIKKKIKKEIRTASVDLAS